METTMIETYHLGRVAFEDGMLDEAQKHFCKLLETDCRFADVFNMMGVASFEKKDWNQAKVYFQDALDINPKYTEARLNLAVTLNELGDYDSAEKAFAKAREAALIDQGRLDPYIKGRLANLHADIGEIYHGLGLHEAAVSEYKRALDLGPTFPDLRTRFGILCRDMGNYDKAISEFSAVKDTHPDYYKAAIQLGITYYSRGDVEFAVKEWIEVKARDPNNQKAIMYLKLADKDIA